MIRESHDDIHHAIPAQPSHPRAAERRWRRISTSPQHDQPSLPTTRTITPVNVTTIAQIHKRLQTSSRRCVPCQVNIGSSVLYMNPEPVKILITVHKSPLSSARYSMARSSMRAGAHFLPKRQRLARRVCEESHNKHDIRTNKQPCS